MHLRAAFVASALVLLTGQVVQPQIRREGKPLESGIDVVMVTATVVDADGHLVAHLPREAFSIWEDGVEQTISVFTNERVPIGLGVLLDVSDSMFGQRIVDARAAVERFLFTLLDPGDEFFLTAFNHAPRTLTPWTSTPSVVHRCLERDPAVRGDRPSTTPWSARCRRSSVATASAPHSCSSRTAPTPRAMPTCATCVRRCCAATLSSMPSPSTPRRNTPSTPA